MRKKKCISLSYYIKDFIHRTVSWKRVASTQNGNNALNLKKMTFVDCKKLENWQKQDISEKMLTSNTPLWCKYTK